MSNEDHIALQKRENDTSPGAAGRGRTRSRILARRLARSLTAEESECVSGARAGDTYAGGTVVKPDIND